MAVNPVPEGYTTLTTYFLAKDGNRFIKFLQEAFGGEVLGRHDGPDGKLMHAEMRIGSARAMVGEPPAPHPPTTVMSYLYVPDADAVYQKALRAGAKSVAEMADQFYGDHAGAVQDAEGNTWWIASRKEELSEEQLKQRMAQKK